MTLVNRNVQSSTGRTSIRLEPEFWDALQDICAEKALSLHDLVRLAETAKNSSTGRTSCIRVYILNHYRAAARRPADKVEDDAS